MYAQSVCVCVCVSMPEWNCVLVWAYVVALLWHVALWLKTASSLHWVAAPQTFKLEVLVRLHIFLHSVTINLTWPHHCLTPYWYLYKSVCKCHTILTDEGSCRLPKHLKYWFSVLASATNWSIWIYLATQVYIEIYIIKSIYILYSIIPEFESIIENVGRS